MASASKMKLAHSVESLPFHFAICANTSLALSYYLLATKYLGVSGITAIQMHPIKERTRLGICKYTQLLLMYMK